MAISTNSSQRYHICTEDTPTTFSELFEVAVDENLWIHQADLDEWYTPNELQTLISSQGRSMSEKVPNGWEACNPVMGIRNYHEQLAQVNNAEKKNAQKRLDKLKDKIDDYYHTKS